MSRETIGRNGRNRKRREKKKRKDELRSEHASGCSIQSSKTFAKWRNEVFPIRRDR
jgi:hypothetical protein